MSTFKENWQRAPKWIRVVIYSVLGILGAVAMGVLFGLVIMWLWNWLMPQLFGLKEITYWQAIGIFVLVKILSGSIHAGSGSKKDKEKKKYKVHLHTGGEGKKEGDGVEYYDEWWESEGKKAFEEFVEVKRDDEDKD
jgi:hypothetical protein